MTRLIARSLTLLCLLSTVAEARVIERIIAIVNEEIVTWSELEDLARPILAQVDQIADPVEREQTRDRQLRRMLDDLVGQRLIMQEASRRRITVDDEAVSEHIERIKAQQSWDDERLSMYLSAQGLSLGEFKKQVREQLLRRQIIRRILGAKLQVSERELKDYYREKLTQAKTDYEVDAAHIILNVPANATPAEEAAVRQQANELRARAEGGEDFTALVGKYSQGPRAQAGGKLGWIRRGNLDPTLEEAFFALEPGSFGGPVRTNFGYHVITVIARKALAPQTYEEAVPTLTQELQDQKLQAEMTRWVADMKKKAFIEIRL